MKTLVVSCCGASVGLGAVTVLQSFRVSLKPLRILKLGRGESKKRLKSSIKYLGAPTATVFAYLVTNWLLVSVVVGIIFGVVPRLTSKDRLRRDERGMAEAIATWTEQLRDTLAGAHGLEQAIVATSSHAPLPIASAVSRLSVQIKYGKLSDGLRRFADDVDHPISDFVSAALITASEYQARDLGQLLGHLAQCARDEGRMRTRIWVGRARTRSSIRIISVVVVSFVLALIVFNRGYLGIYASVEGQVILSAILVLFAVALILLDQFSRIDSPQRFIRRREIGMQ